MDSEKQQILESVLNKMIIIEELAIETAKLNVNESKLITNQNATKDELIKLVNAMNIKR